MKSKFGIGLVSSTSVVLSASLAVAQSAAETPDGAADTGLVSLLDEAPKAYFGFK